MTQQREPLPDYLAEPFEIGTEISVTGKWVPNRRRRIWGQPAESRSMREELQQLIATSRDDEGVLSIEVNDAVGQDAVLVHHVFRDADALSGYIANTAAAHAAALQAVARPELHLVRGIEISDGVRNAITDRVPAAYGRFLFGYVKDDYRRPNPATAIQVTAKWTCKPGESSHLEELQHWWQRVGTDAHSLEEGLLRYEAYEAVGEDALIIHETFEDTAELRFHLQKGTAARYKKEIDAIAEPEAYYFRGPVSWLIRTYSKFMRLPATYSRVSSQFIRPGGSKSEGTTE